MKVKRRPIDVLNYVLMGLTLICGALVLATEIWPGEPGQVLRLTFNVEWADPAVTP